MEEMTEKAKSNANVASYLPMVGRPTYLDNKKSIELLGMKYNRNILDSAVEEAYSLIKNGSIPDKR